MISPHERKRAISTAIALASSVVISLVFLVYAFIQKSEAEQNARLVEELKAQLVEVRTEAEMQKKIAQENLMMAQKATELAQRQASELMKNKN